ncbi:hypothetical protein CEE45_04810 [Candidatus Heimdallarchaeota archaeon B3_Heim]|nr:MAG: hypothetical protein CEE45_04810 [Candidatus Heimdallarchaeota archaeon B3_Heim]
MAKREREYPEKGLLGFLTHEQIQEALEHYMKRGETSYLDFKSGRIKPKNLAKTMAAMANSASGMIVLGVEEKNADPWQGITDIKEWTKKINQIATDSFGTPFNLKIEVIHLPRIINPFILIHIPLSPKGIWYGGRYFYRVNDETKFFRGSVTDKIKLHQDEKLSKTLGFTAIYEVLFTLIKIKREDNTEVEVKKLVENIEAESLSEDVIPKELALIVTHWNKLKLRRLSTMMEEKEGIMKRVNQVSEMAFILLIINVFGIWFAITFFRSEFLGFYIGVEASTLFFLSFVYLSLATIYLGVHSHFKSKTKERRYDKVISPFRFPDINKVNELTIEQKFEDLKSEIARIIAHLRFHNMTKYFRTSKNILIGYDSDFDPYFPSEVFKEWLKLRDTSLSNEISDEMILKSRIYNIAFHFSKFPNKIKIVSDILNIGPSDINKYLDLSPHEKRMILKYDRYYYLFYLEKVIQTFDTEIFWEDSDVDFAGFLVGEKIELIDT